LRRGSGVGYVDQLTVSKHRVNFIENK
jgi:hypothetical protein